MKKHSGETVNNEALKSEAGAYAHWYETHKLSAEMKTIQAKSVFKISPAFLFVYTVHCASEPLFADHIEALKAQTYGAFRCFFIDRSGDSNVRAAMREIAEKDPRFVCADESAPAREASEIMLTERLAAVDKSVPARVLSESVNSGSVSLSDAFPENYVCFLEDFSRPEPDFLYEIVKEINEKRENPELVYTDSDTVDAVTGAHHTPCFKPDDSPAYLRAMNYIGDLYAVSADCLRRAGALSALLEKDPYDRLLRISDECVFRVFHLSKVLFSVYGNVQEKAGELYREIPSPEERRQIAGYIRNSFLRRGVRANVTPMEEPHSYEMHPETASETPLVSILIPNKDHKEDLERVISSLFTVSTYQNIEIIVIENNSENADIFAYYETLKNDTRVRVVTYEEKGFNYSAINNFGARFASGEYLLLLNNDTQVIAPDFIASMVAYQKAFRAGAVGAKLLYGDGTMQHAGILVGEGEIYHMYFTAPEEEYGYMNRTLLPSNVSAVTGACLLTPRALYEELQGLDEELAVSYNDVEYCLNLQAHGYPVIYDAFAKLFHFESKSRGYDDTKERAERLEKEKGILLRRYPERLEKDPYYNDNFSLKYGYFKIRVEDTNWLQNDRDRLFLNIDMVLRNEETATVAGWAISTKHDVSFQILNSRREEIPYTFETVQRTDASVAIMRSFEKAECGFRIHFADTDRGSYRLLVSDGEITKEFKFGLSEKELRKRQFQVKDTMRTYVRDRKLIRASLKEEGGKRFRAQVSGDMMKDKFRYPEWFEKHRAGFAGTGTDAEALSYRPLISLIVPAYRTPEKFLLEMVDSVKAQTYENWELCIADGSFPDRSVSEVLARLHAEDPRITYKVLSENKGISGNTNEALSLATGEWIALMDHDDVLDPAALYEMVRVMNAEPEADAIYTDEDKISMDLSMVFEPAMKPDYDYELLSSQNYICHLFAARKSVFSEAGLFDPDTDGAQDLDYILRTTEIARKTVHIPKVLYHWRSHPNSTAGDSLSKMYCYEAGKRAVNKALKRKGISGEAFSSVFFGRYHIFYDLPAEKPLISVILWGGDEDARMKTEKSVREYAPYPSYEFIRTDFPENGAQEAHADYLWFLRAGSEIVPFLEKAQNGHYLSEDMVRRKASPANLLMPLVLGSADAVGGKVLDADSRVSFGVTLLSPVFGVNEPLRGALEESLDHAGLSQHLIDRHSVNILNLTNLMIRREAYEAAGGADSAYRSAYKSFALSLSLRRKGFHLVLDPTVVSRLPYANDERPRWQESPEDCARFVKEFKDLLNAPDPYASPNMTWHMNRYVLKEQ